MVIGQALDLVIAQTGHERFRSLCDPSHTDFRPDYVGLVMKLAIDPSLITSPLQPSRPRPHLSNGRLLDLVQRIHACPHWSKSDCGCLANCCAIGKGEGGRVTIEDCRECLDGCSEIAGS